MSHIVARMQKMKAGNLGGAYRHNERIFENHANKDIDTGRSHLNYELTDRERSVSYEKQIKDYVNENKISQRAIRKDAVLCDEWIITSDKAFFEKLSPGETRSFFEAAKDYFAENYGEQNIAYASVHMDESTPHMHLGIVPMQDGKLSSKAMFDREELKKIQDELPQYMKEQGFELERGARNSEAKHKTVSEFKKDMADKEIEKELEEKHAELEEIDFKVSKKLSELDKHKSNINTLEEKKNSLEAKIEGYKDELRDYKQAKLKSDDWRNEFKGKLKKSSITGKETVVLDKKTYDDARWKFVNQENRLTVKDKEMRELKTQLDNVRSASYKKSRELDELKSVLKDLQIENKQLRTQNKGLRERLDLMARKLNVWRKTAKEKLPRAEFKDLSKQLNRVQPLKEIIKPLKVLTKVKDVIEKSLF